MSNSGTEAARLLAECWTARTRRPRLPESLRPADLPAAYGIQAHLAARLGPVGAWKSGAGSAEAVPAGSAIPAAAIVPADSVLPSAEFGRLGVEIEICLRLGRDLPPRPAPYTRTELLDAVAALLPAIEVVDSRYADWPELPWPEQVADLQNCARLVPGPELSDWRGFDFGAVRARLSVGGVLRADRVNGNTAGDILRTVLWLVNEGPARATGLAAGQLITTGSLNGLHFAAPGDRVVGEVEGLGSVAVSFS